MSIKRHVFESILNKVLITIFHEKFFSQWL